MLASNTQHGRQTYYNKTYAYLKNYIKPVNHNNDKRFFRKIPKCPYKRSTNNRNRPGEENYLDDTAALHKSQVF